MRAFFALFLFCVMLPDNFGQNTNDMNNMPKYDVRYDYLDIDAILDSKRLVRNYVDCLINSVRCTPEGKALKRILPEALRTKCARCTERQKRTAVKVIRRLKYEYPDEWSKLSSRWDPTGDFTRFFEEYLDKETFNTIYGNGNEIPGTLSSKQPLPPRSPTLPPGTTGVPTQPPTFQPPRTPAPSYVPPNTPASALPPVDASTPPRPVILNRFGDDGELMVGSPSSVPQPEPSAPPSATVIPPRPTIQPRPQTTWALPETVPTRFPLRPDMPPVYTTAITFIDQIGYKIIRTTELVTDILRNTVRAVVG